MVVDVVPAGSILTSKVGEGCFQTGTSMLEVDLLYMTVRWCRHVHYGADSFPAVAEPEPAIWNKSAHNH